MAFGLSAGAVTAIGMGAGALLSGGGSQQSGSATQQQQLDPRMQAMLYGSQGGTRQLRPGVAPIYGQPTYAEDGKMIAPGQSNPDSDYITTGSTPGLLDAVAGMQNQPQKPGMSSFGGLMDGYVGYQGGQDFLASQGAARGLQGSNISAPQMAGAQIKSPSQNNLDLAPAYKDMIYGQAGNNPYLTGAIQKGINQSNNAFGNYTQDATKATQDLLGNIRGGAVMNGQMGGTRQGIAEGRAIGDLTQNLGRAASQFGQNNTDAAVSAQAGAYDADRNRALSAMSGLGAQQYGVAAQQAQLDQQRAMANQQAQLGTNQLNSANTATGIGASSGLLNQAYGYGGNNDTHDLNHLGQVAGILQPFAGFGQSTSSPLYSNPMGNAVGGATAGLGLYNAYKGATNTGSYNSWAGNNAGVMDSTGLSPSGLLAAF